MVAIQRPQLGQIIIVDDDLKSADHPRGKRVPGTHDCRHVGCCHLAHVSGRLGPNIGQIAARL